MHNILEQYTRLLESIDLWFQGALNKFPQEIACRLGCSGCCRGFFDITMMDAALVAQGYQLLEPERRESIRRKAAARLEELERRWPGFRSPFLLNSMPDSEWTDMPEEDDTPCPFLADDGLCLVYAYRPMSCRLHGLPNIDTSGESFSDDCCSLNFQSQDPLSRPELKWGFRQTFQQELSLFSRYTEQLTGRAMNELDTLLQTVPLIDFEQTDWQHLTLSPRPESESPDA